MFENTVKKAYQAFYLDYALCLYKGFTDLGAPFATSSAFQSSSKQDRIVE